MQAVQMAGGSVSAGTAAKQQGMALAKSPAAETGNNHRFRLYTSDTTVLVSSLVDFSRSQSLQMSILNIRPPSLEDAFVRLTEEKSHGK